jgi:hypothetical protein
MSEKICEHAVVFICEIDKILFYIDENGYIYKNFIHFSNPIHITKECKFWLIKHTDKYLLVSFLDHKLNIYEIKEEVSLLQSIVIKSILVI